ncbi:MAG: DUF3990 domain-containing protein [Coprobacillaceae bacterium]
MKDSQLEKYINQDTWFHDTTLARWENMCKSKVIFDYNRGTELDFGFGFYMAPKYQQAKNYIKRMLPYLNEEISEEKWAVVIEFEIVLSQFIKTHSYKTFLKFDDSFSLFVFNNRNNSDIQNHNYDFIIGVMTDSNPVDLLAKYRSQVITLEEVISGLKIGNSMQQVSLHTQNLCDKLRVKKVTLIDTGKELNANDYNTNRNK